MFSAADKRCSISIFRMQLFKKTGVNTETLETENPVQGIMQLFNVSLFWIALFITKCLFIRESKCFLLCVETLPLRGASRF